MSGNIEDHIRSNSKDTTRIDFDDETSIEIGDVQNLDGSEIHSNEDVETNETNTHNTNLRSEKAILGNENTNSRNEKCNLVNEKASLDINKSCKGKAKNEFVTYNLGQPGQNPFQTQRSILVYFQSPRPLPTEGEPFSYDPESRNGFIRMVFTLVFIMLCTTISCAMAGKIIEPFTVFLISPIGAIMAIVMMVLTFILHYVMYCSNCSRSPPMNYICLMIATIGYSYIVAFITIRYRTAIIVGAFLGTAGIALVCMILACSSFDFTKYLLYFIVISVAIAAALLGYMLGKQFFGFDMKPLHIGLLIAATVLNAIMLIMELQMILGGRTVELGVDDYALGAYMLYVSIIELFLKLIQIIDHNPVLVRTHTSRVWYHCMKLIYCLYCVNVLILKLNIKSTTLTPGLCPHDKKKKST